MEPDKADVKADVSNVLDARIDKLWKRVESGDYSVVDEDRRALGKMLSEKHAALVDVPLTKKGMERNITRGDKTGRRKLANGFGAWCQSRGYSTTLARRFMGFSDSAYTVFSEYLYAVAPSQAPETRRAQHAAKKAEHEYLKRKAAAGIIPPGSADHPLRAKAMQALREKEAGELDRQKEERAAAREKARLEREVLEAELNRIKAGQERYRYPLTEALRETARNIVRVGFAELAQRAHPDKGGTAEQMAALVAGRNWILSAMEHPLIHRVLQESGLRTERSRT